MARMLQNYAVLRGQLGLNNPQNEASLFSLRHGLFRLRDDEQRARLEEARAQLTLAQDAFRRAKTLAAQNTVSEAEFDRASADLQAARARRDLARVELERTEIRAPFDGVLGARMVSPGVESGYR